MSSTSPSPNTSPVANPPNTTTTSPPSPPSTSSPPPTSSPTPPLSQPNGTSDPPTQSSPPPSSSPSPPANSTPPSVPAAPPPVSLSPPPVSSSPPPVSSSPPPVSSSPPPVPLSPPPSTPAGNRPVVPTSPPALQPPPSNTPSPPAQIPPPTSQPVVPSPPPPVDSPPSPNQSPPVSPSPPTATPPSPATVSPPPPATIVSPPPSGSPPSPPSDSQPPPSAKPPKQSRSPPSPLPPPPVSQTTSPPPAGSPPDPSSPPVNGTQPTPSSPIPPSSVPPTLAPRDNSSTGSVLSPPAPIKPVEGPANTSTDSANSNTPGGISTGGAAAIGVVVFLVLGLVAGVILFYRRRKKKVSGYHAGHVMPSPLGSSPTSDASYIKAYSSAPLIGSSSGSDFIYSPSESGGLGNPRSTFTYEELMEATDGFSTQNLLGEGGFGCVYKGILADGREVAVKQLKVGGSQGEREFSAEVETISRVHHRHLVSLVGYCISDHHRLLVYDFVANNTLYYHLHEEGRAPMDWATRVKVATGAARGISYLHEDCHPRIIHRDIKSSNILLDNNFDAQVSDFGLARLALDVYTHVSTRVMGTFGYMAPEYASSGKLTEKSDVYSFGVVLLELITGRKPVDASQPLGDESLVEWARPLMNDAIEKRDLAVLIDPKLENNYIETEMFRMIEAAAACVRHSAVKRPRMGQVVRALDSISDDQDLTNGARLGQSEVYDSGYQSAEIRMFQRMAFGTQDYSTDAFSRSSWGTNA